MADRMADVSLLEALLHLDGDETISPPSSSGAALHLHEPPEGGRPQQRLVSDHMTFQTRTKHIRLDGLMVFIN